MFKGASVCFDWSNLFLDQSKLFWNCLKFFKEASVYFDQSKLIFDQSKLVNQVFKKSDLTCSNHFFKNFSKLFLSLWLGKAPQQIFCRFPPNFLQGFSLHKPVCPYYLFFCIVFHDFMHYFMVFWVNFRTMHKLGFLINQALFWDINQRVLLLYWYIHDLWWLIWSIWGFVKN